METIYLVMRIDTAGGERTCVTSVHHSKTAAMSSMKRLVIDEILAVYEQDHKHLDPFKRTEHAEKKFHKHLVDDGYVDGGIDRYEIQEQMLQP